MSKRIADELSITFSDSDEMHFQVASTVIWGELQDDIKSHCSSLEPETLTSRMAVYIPGFFPYKLSKTSQIDGSGKQGLSWTIDEETESG